MGLRLWMAGALFAVSVPVMGEGQSAGTPSGDTVSHPAPDSTKTAHPDTAPTITYGGFLDTYYAWDTDQPRNFDRAYTTQPARHAEFNINLAFLEAKVDASRYRGRLAIQYGTSVQANYAGEPVLGHVSGPNVTQFIQEATVGYRLTGTLWVDGGIFFAHTGYEGWISRDNLAYTRSLIAEFSPYYEAGVKFTWNPTQKLTAQFDILNGWQNVSNYNTPPAGGIRLDYTLTPTLTLSYDNFLGNVAADSAPRKIRFYNDMIAQYNPSRWWQFAGAFDVGTQGGSADGGTATAMWYGATVFAKYHPTTRLGIVARVERYSDPHQVIVQTNLPYAFAASGASIGTDVTPASRVLWRTELRGFHSDHRVWPTHREGGYAAGDAFAVTSLALTL